MTPRLRLHGAILGSVLSSIAALVVAAGAGCQSHVTLTEAPGLGGGGGGGKAQKFSSNMAVFAVDGNSRMTIVLALQPTGVKPSVAPPPPAGTAPAGAELDPLPFRLYLLLTVQGGGGAEGLARSFQIGQRLSCGPVCARYYVYDESGQMNIVLDSRGTIQTKTMMLFGGLTRNDWWISGTFDLVMSSQVSLSGSFVARPSPVLVERFLRNCRL
jgi:hypothetical protein